MNPQQILTGAQDAMTARRVFGDPVQAGDVTLLPVAVVAGGGGGGEKGANEGGAGFGLSARPAGVFAIRDGKVQWRPAVNVNRAILGGRAELPRSLRAPLAVLTPILADVLIRSLLSQRRRWPSSHREAAAGSSMASVSAAAAHPVAICEIHWSCP